MPTTRRLLTPEDALDLKSVSDPQISPDGRWIACVITRTDRERDKYVSDIWLVAANGRKRVQLTNRHHRDGSPRWSPQGDLLAFVSPESEEEKAVSQIWVIPVCGGEARPVTRLKQGASRAGLVAGRKAARLRRAVPSRKTRRRGRSASSSWRRGGFTRRT